MWRVLWLLVAAAPAMAEDEGSGSDTGMWAAIVGAINAVKNYVLDIFNSIEKFVTWCGDLIVAVFKAAWDFITDAVVWMFEGLFKIAAEAITGVSDSLGIDAFAAKVQALWSSIPVEVLQVLSTIGISSALAIVVAGILIRFALQLIPFVRLGS